MKRTLWVASWILILSGGFPILYWFGDLWNLGGIFCSFLAGATLVIAVLMFLMARMQKKAEKMHEEHRSGYLKKPPVIDEGSALYGWKVRDLDGIMISFDKFTSETLFLNFWSTQCIPCVKELASIEKLHAAVSPEGVKFMCIATDPDLDRLRAWVEVQKVTVPVYALVDDEIPSAFDSNFIPATYIINPDGRIVLKHEGAAQWDHPKVATFLRSIQIQSILGPEPVENRDE